MKNSLHYLLFLLTCYNIKRRNKASISYNINRPLSPKRLYLLVLRVSVTTRFWTEGMPMRKLMGVLVETTCHHRSLHLNRETGTTVLNYKPHALLGFELAELEECP